jgi:hypothetical protein
MMHIKTKPVSTPNNLSIQHLDREAEFAIVVSMHGHSWLKFNRDEGHIEPNTNRQIGLQQTLQQLCM